MERRTEGRLHLLGILVHLPAVLVLTTLPVCVGAGETALAPAFLACGVLSAACGQALVRRFRPFEEADLHDAMVVAALAWIVVPAIGAAPFLWLGRVAGDRFAEAAVFAAPIDAFFEAASGFTGTGLTMSAHPSALPRSLQWWRSASQWVGGLGVIVLMLAVVRPAASALHLYRAEAREERALPSVASTVRAHLGIYVAWTLVGIVALRATGAPTWEAVHHGLTAVATGGFTIVDRGDGLGTIATRAVLLALMVVGATSFHAHARMLRERSLRALWADGQHRVFGVLLVGFVAALLVESRASGGAFRVGESAFQAISALCTAGFQTASLDAWSEGALLLLVVAMVVGGAAGSTCGGIKTARVYLLLKGLAWRHRDVLRRPHEVVRHELDGRGVERDEAIGAVEVAAVLVLAWVGFLLLGALALLHAAPAGTGLAAVLVEVASAQGNVGLSAGITGPSLPAGGKLVLLALMWVGRLELLPVLVLLHPRRR